MKLCLLDLFSGAGGAARGYQLAGFYVVGVDIKPQPHYCGDEFHQTDALEFVAKHGHEFDVIHASPPCQDYTVLRVTTGGKRYPRMIGATREALTATGKPYVIENVEGAASELVLPLMLCGIHFGLKVYRHRLFETNPWLMSLPHAPHEPGESRQRQGHKNGRGFVTVTGHCFLADYARAAMGIDWMTRDELSQAIPPAYTEWIGKQLMTILQAAK